MIAQEAVVFLSVADLARAEAHGKKRNASMDHVERKNSFNMIANKPPWWRDYVGRAGEIAYGRFSKHEPNAETFGQGDDGTDFPGGVQVKSSDIDKKPNLMFPVRQWERKRAKIYVLVWIRFQPNGTAEAHLLGWLTREQIEKLKTLEDYGRGETWVVHHSKLNPVWSLRI